METLEAEKIIDLWVECPDESRLIIGENDYGFLRAICITGGKFTGKLNGKVLPIGADWNKGFGGDNPEKFTSIDLSARYLLKTEDNVF